MTDDYQALVWAHGDEDDEPLVIDFDQYDDVRGVARTACDKFWSDHDGYEWMSGGCKLTIDMRGHRHVVDVSVDFEPSWWPGVESSGPIPNPGDPA